VQNRVAGMDVEKYASASIPNFGEHYYNYYYYFVTGIDEIEIVIII